jgi:hypothetical protein
MSIRLKNTGRLARRECEGKAATEALFFLVCELRTCFSFSKEGVGLSTEAVHICLSIYRDAATMFCDMRH